MKHERPVHSVAFVALEIYIGVQRVHIDQVEHIVPTEYFDGHCRCGKRVECMSVKDQMLQ